MKQPANKFAWTEAQNAEVIALHRAGMSYGEIATAIHRSPLAVRARLFRLGEITMQDSIAGIQA